MGHLSVSKTCLILKHRPVNPIGDDDQTVAGSNDSATDLAINTPTKSWKQLFRVHPVVFPVAATVILGMVLSAVAMPELWSVDRLTRVRDSIGQHFGWFYVGIMNASLALSLFLAFGPYGKIRLGRPDEQPEFGLAAWFSMLFSAGMGIGLLFYSVAEPISHYLQTPPGFPADASASRVAMATTIFHWGIHPWALYCAVGLSLAYYSFRHQQPLSFRSLLSPIFGKRVDGLLGDAVDVATIVATMIGVATSLGVGARQVNAGLAFLFNWNNSPLVQTVLIAAITLVATVSVCLGLNTGIRRLSEGNMSLAFVLLLAVIAGVGVSSYLAGFLDSIGAYLQMLPTHAFRTGVLDNDGVQWLNDWTVFYWAWWIAWSPFVGMFIARVSRGRTIREFVIGTLLVPTLVGIAWLTAFGNAALQQHAEVQKERVAAQQSDDIPLPSTPTYEVAVLDEEGQPELGEDGRFVAQTKPLTAVEYLNSTIVTADHTGQIATLPTVLFVMLDGMFSSAWITTLTVGIATICIVLFFVTSSDSASMVIDIIASGGDLDPPIGTRLFWAISEGLVAASLLAVGGLKAFQAVSIAAALPMAVIILLAGFGLLISLRRDSTG